MKWNLNLVEKLYFLLLVRLRSPHSIEEMIVRCPLVALLWRQSENEAHQVFVAYDKTVEQFMTKALYGVSADTS